MASSDDKRDNERNKKVYLYLLQSTEMAERRMKKMGCGDRSWWRQEYQSSRNLWRKSIRGPAPKPRSCGCDFYANHRTSPTPIMEESNWMSHRWQSSATHRMTCLES
ncbi:hypothetical protein ACFX13_047233 [Malus domestica]